MTMRGNRLVVSFWLTTLLLAGTPNLILAQENEPKQPATADDAVPSVQEIVEKADRTAYYQGKDGSAKVSMTITDSQGRTRQRRFTILRMDAPPPGGEPQDEAYCGDQKFYVYFHLPADVNKMAFLVWKQVDKDDDRWLYLPAMDLVKRIAAAEKRTSFVGSHFFYEDVSGRNVNADEHELVDTSENYYVLKNRPKDPASVEFAYYKMWIHRKTFTTVKVEYYDNKEEKYREYEALGVETIQGYPTVTKSRMKNLRADGNTVIEYTNVKYDIGLPEDIFTERYLRRPPLKYLR